MLKAVKLPAGIADLNTSLTNVDWDALSHFLRKVKKKLNDDDLAREGRAETKIEGVYQDALRWKLEIIDLEGRTSDWVWYIAGGEEEERERFNRRC